MNRKLILIDVCGYSWFFAGFLIYNVLESRCEDWLAAAGGIAWLLPGAVLWHKNYNRYSAR